jgi:hypothetical protein
MVEAGIHVLTPEVSIGVAVEELGAWVMVEFQVIMGVDPTRTEDAAFKVNLQGARWGTGQDGRTEMEVTADKATPTPNGCTTEGQQFIVHSLSFTVKRDR